MKFEPLGLPGAVRVRMERHSDERGFFARAACVREFAAQGLSGAFPQSSISWNPRRGTVRGLHFQWPPSNESKLVRCVRGSIHDVLLDLRPDSPTYLAACALELNQDSRDGAYIPSGVAHGFQTLTDECEVLYQMTDFHEPSLASGVRWNDPAFAISWPISTGIVIAPRDAQYTDFNRQAFERELALRRTASAGNRPVKATVTAAVDAGSGAALYRFAERLYPICRSITGQGVRQTLALIAGRVPLQVHEVRSGTRVFDWQIPLEWNVEDAAVIDADGRRVVDFQAHNLHLVGYSEPVQASMPLEELAPRLHILPDRPDWIPYRTSYYKRSWGFCMAARERARLKPGRYRVKIKTSLAPGSLTYGELLLRGRSRDEVLFFTHTCHPSLANDNVSGMSIATALAEWVASTPRYFTYRFVFAPGTIGSLTWLKRNEAALKRVRHALVLGLLGDSAPLTYKRSRRENCEIDQIASYVLAAEGREIAFSPYGYDERQLCSPGFDLPAGRLTRSVNGGYAEYHTSADDLSLITPSALAASLAACQRIVEVMESNRRYTNLKPKGEPQLGSRGLYGSLGGRAPTESEHALLWVLNQSDGQHSLLDIARRSGVPFVALRDAAHALEAKKLLRCDEPGSPAAPGGRKRRTSKSGRDKS